VDFLQLKHIKLEILKKDKLYEDAIQTTAASKNIKLSEELLAYFAELGKPDCFEKTLNSCHDYIRLDVALELSWKNKYIDNAFPYFIRVLRDYIGKIDDLTARLNASPNAEGHNMFPQVVGFAAPGQHPVALPIGGAPVSGQVVFQDPSAVAGPFGFAPAPVFETQFSAFEGPTSTGSSGFQAPTSGSYQGFGEPATLGFSNFTSGSL